MDLRKKFSQAKELYRHEKYEEALEIYQVCYEYSKNQIGKNHTSTTICLIHMERCYRQLKQYQNSIDSLSSLADFYYKAGDFEKVLKINLSCYELKIKRLSELHKDTLVILNKIAISCGKLINYYNQNN